MRNVTIAIAQFASVMGNPDANLKKAIGAMEQAAQKGADIIVFPELYYQGYYNPIDLFHEIAETKDGALYQSLSEACRKNNIFAVMGYCEKKVEQPGKVFNSLMFVDNEGNQIADYTKVYGWDTEKDIFTDGDHFDVCDTKIGKIGLLTCYDIEFPETFRLLNMKGAEMVICCSAWRTYLQHRWDAGLASGATANLCFVVGCNTVGVNPAYQQLCGDSQVIRPNGHIIDRADENEQILYTTIDLDEVKRERDAYPIWKDYHYDMFDKNLLNLY